MGLGTDSSCPFVTQYDMWREVAYFAGRAWANAFALQRPRNAELLGLGGETGTRCARPPIFLDAREPAR